jgi:pimeloyl-ACP methyl ester carboxylesterase
MDVPQLLITGESDAAVPPRFVERYAAEARQGGDVVDLVILENAGHFEVVAPWWPGWSEMQATILAFLEEHIP